MGYVVSFVAVDEERGEVEERWLVGQADAEGEVTLRVEGCATPFPRRWVCDLATVAAVFEAYLGSGDTSDASRWERTVDG